MEAHAWLQALFRESPMAIGFSRDGLLLDANPAYVRLFGYGGVDELRGRSILVHIAPSHHDQVVETIHQRALGQPAPQRYQSRGLRKDGTEFSFEVTTARVVVGGEPLTIAFVTDVSEREDGLEALRASEERFRTLSAAAFEGVFVHADGKVLLANETGAAMYGFDDPAAMIGASLMDYTAPESRESVADHIRRGASEPYEGIARRRDGTRFFAEAHGKTLSHQGRPTRVTVIRDITERKRVEAEQRALGERVRQAQKLESLGVLAGGVAHDFNNLLTIIRNSVALAQREGDVGPAAAPHLEAVELAAQRAAELCGQMLAYAGKASFAREAIDLSRLVGEMSSMLEVSIARKVTLARDLAPWLPPILGDPTQIRQVIMNLVLNASEAIDAADGKVVVATGQETCGPDALARAIGAADLKPGPYVHVEVRDDGAGMDGPTVAQMFDPFFTTKFMGRGLGMAAVLGIVRGHGGAIDVESRPGGGTRVRVSFPASVAPSPVKAASGDVDLEGRGVVLVVDDERILRVSTKRLLEKHGFEVLVASDGVEALEVFHARAGRVDVVLLDLTMPRMNGIETTRALRRIAPRLPIVLSSGYGATPLGDAKGAEDEATPDAILAKPYSADQLLTTLKQAIRRAREPGTTP